MMSIFDISKKTGLSTQTIEKLNTIFKKHSYIEEAILYGSRAKGNFRNGSDIDITIKGKDISYSEVLEIEEEIDNLLLPYTVDFSNYDSIENQDLISHIDRVGMIIYSLKN